jgi:hypothetical protein
MKNKNENKLKSKNKKEDSLNPVALINKDICLQILIKTHPIIHNSLMLPSLYSIPIHI